MNFEPDGRLVGGAGSAPNEQKRMQYQRRWASLKSIRSSWDTQWRDLSDFIEPRQSRFQVSEHNRGERKDSRIINGIGQWAARTLAAGMMAGITSPSRTWFRITTRDPELAEIGAVKEWLHIVERRAFEAMGKSNIYNVLHQIYGDIGTPGTAAAIIEEDDVTVLRGYVFPIGSYCLASSSRNKVDTMYRQLSLSAAQMVKDFGKERCSGTVRTAAETHPDQVFTVLHLVEPNTQFKEGALGWRGKRWLSCWLEESTDSSYNGLLRQSGYDECPLLAPRWGITGEDVYGHSPGMQALGDAKALQTLERRKGQAVEKIVNPPMVGPVELEHQRVNLLPGETTFVSNMSPSMTLQPAVLVDPRVLPAIETAIREHEQRIRQAYYADLWLMMQGADTQMTAREVTERHEEKMLQLGPVMERLQDELLNPLFERVIAILFKRGMLPDPPEELQGSELKVEYQSIMTQAQRRMGIGDIDRLGVFVGSLATYKTDVVDKIDIDQAVDEYAVMLGVPPSIIRPDDEVEEVRTERARQQQAAQQAEVASQAVQGAKVLSETDVSSDNALTRIMGGGGGL